MKAKYKHIAYGIGMTDARSIAFRDITEDARQNNTKNYARQESTVLESLRRTTQTIIPLNV
jgi:hypothetical protein